MSGVPPSSSASSVSVARDLLPGTYRCLGTKTKLTGREVLLMRHGETIEEVFPDWIRLSKLGAHYYVPFDLNVPVSLAKRNGMCEAYGADPPLSEFGKLSSQVFARHLSTRCSPLLPPINVIAAPTFASVQTAHEVVSYMRGRCNKIVVEPGLTGDLRGFFHWMDVQKWRDLGMQVEDRAESAWMPDKNESVAATAQRITTCLKHIISHYKGIIIVISDAVSTSIMTRWGRGLESRLSEYIGEEKELASATFPPGSCLAFKNYKVALEYTDILRPMTACAFSTAVDLDEGVDWRAEHNF